MHWLAIHKGVGICSLTAAPQTITPAQSEVHCGGVSEDSVGGSAGTAAYLSSSQKRFKQLLLDDWSHGILGSPNEPIKIFYVWFPMPSDNHTGKISSSPLSAFAMSICHGTNADDIDGSGGICPPNPYHPSAQ